MNEYSCQLLNVLGILKLDKNWIFFYWNHFFEDFIIANGQGDQGLIPGWVIAKTQKWYLMLPYLIKQYYKVKIKDKVEQPRELSSTLPYAPV